MIIEFPVQAKVDKPIAKEKIYGKAGVKTALRNAFVKEVEKIIWLYKLAPETINIAATEKVLEIQVLLIELRTDELDEEVLRCLDRAIPHPILFRLRRNGKLRMLAALKRPNEADETKRVLSEYFGNDWVSEGEPGRSLPFASNLESLYDLLLRPMIPYPARENETLREHVERAEKIAQKEREIERLRTRMRKERQFSREAEMNGQLHRLQDEMEKLTSPPR